MTSPDPLPAQTATPGEALPPLPDSAYPPDAVPLPATCATCGGPIYQRTGAGTRTGTAWLHLNASDWADNVHPAEQIRDGR